MNRYQHCLTVAALIAGPGLLSCDNPTERSQAAPIQQHSLSTKAVPSKPLEVAVSWDGCLPTSVILYGREIGAPVLSCATPECLARHIGPKSEIRTVIVLPHEFDTPLSTSEAPPFWSVVNQAEVNVVFIRTDNLSAERLPLGVVEWRAPFWNPEDDENFEYLVNGRSFGNGERGRTKAIEALSSLPCKTLLLLGSQYSRQGGFAGTYKPLLNQRAQIDAAMGRKNGIVIEPDAGAPPWLLTWPSKKTPPR
jgi:hypothetical protein